MSDYKNICDTMGDSKKHLVTGRYRVKSANNNDDRK